MSSLKLILAVLACVAAVSAQSNYTCVGNPYFSSPYNPNPFQPGTTNPTILNGWNVTYNNNTGIYNLTNYTGLPACQNLLTTGSCCGPDYINQSVQAYSHLFNATSDNVIGLFNQRINRLQSYAANYGKMIGTFVDVITRGHQIVFKIVQNINGILGDPATLGKLMTMISNTNATDIAGIISSGNMSNASSLDVNQLANVTYQLVNIVGGIAGIAPGDIISFFGSIRALQTALATLPSSLLVNFNPLPDADPALVSDALDAWLPILMELSSRAQNITLTINYGALSGSRLRRMLQTSMDFPVSFPLILDPRNIEAISGAFLAATKNTTSSNQFFNILLNNASSIYAAINATWFTNIKSINDVQTGGSWDNTKQLLIQMATYSFNDSLAKVVSVAQNKKKCLNVIFQYTGYLGCLACDASALALGKILVNNVTGTFSPVVSSTFGSYIQGNCSDYLNDLQFINAYLQGLSAIKSAYDINGLSKQNPSQVNTDISQPVPPVNASSLESQFNIPCSVSSSTCNWAPNNLVDSLGATTGFLCDFDTTDCANMTYLMSLRRPQYNNGAQKRLLDDSTGSSGSVQYSDAVSDEVSTTNVGFSTQANYTVDANATANVTANTTPNTDNSSNNTNASNNTNSSNGTKFGLKALVSIPLIIATIVAFLL